MTGLLVSLGVVLLMFGCAVVTLGIIIWLLPDTEKLIPAQWRRALSLQYGIYYCVAGLALAVLPG